MGLAHRKLHHYERADRQLGWVVKRCADQDLSRRAMYLQAKVVSIYRGLDAIPVIESFAQRFADHSMVDDVLFWAGDLYQRRARYLKAESYFRRIENLPAAGDHCADARWRRAWISYRRGKLDKAQSLLEEGLADTDCSPGRFEQARIRYWLGRINQRNEQIDDAVAYYEDILDQSPLGYYGQLALARLLEVEPEAQEKRRARFKAPQGSKAPAMCAGDLNENKTFRWGLKLLLRGLTVDAQPLIQSVAREQREVLARSHAVSQGLTPKVVTQDQKIAQNEHCREKDPQLLLTLLLDRAGALREAHWRLRTEFGELLERLPLPENVGIFRAAYPLAHRKELQAAEQENNLPPYLLQALSREESAFDAEGGELGGSLWADPTSIEQCTAGGQVSHPPPACRKNGGTARPEHQRALGWGLDGFFYAPLQGTPCLVPGGIQRQRPFREPPVEETSQTCL